MEDYKTVTQVTLSMEQRVYADEVDNFSGKVSNYIIENYKDLKDLKFQEYKGQKVAKFVTNKSISIPVSLREKVKKDKVSLSNLVRNVIDNKYI